MWCKLFIRKVFLIKILLSKKFSLFLTLRANQYGSSERHKWSWTLISRTLCIIIITIWSLILLLGQLDMHHTCGSWSLRGAHVIMLINITATIPSKNQIVGKNIRIVALWWALGESHMSPYLSLTLSPSPHHIYRCHPISNNHTGILKLLQKGGTHDQNGQHIYS